MSSMFARSVFTVVTAFATLAAVELTAPQVASADADPSKSPAADDITLTKGAMSRLEKNLADKADWATDKKARETARTRSRWSSRASPAFARQIRGGICRRGTGR